MKSARVFILLYLTLSVLACQDSKDHIANKPADHFNFKTIGEEIPFETGMRWMDFYKNTNREQGRVSYTSSFGINSTEFLALVHSVSPLTGIAFHYGIDELGNTHILVIPVNASLGLWFPSPGRIIVDANTGNEINLSIAKTWAQNYKNANPNSIWFHFFGKNIFDDISAIPYFNALDIEPALNDVELTPELLLIIWNDEADEANGRAMQSTGKIYDASSPCPPCPPIE